MVVIGGTKNLACKNLACKADWRTISWNCDERVFDCRLWVQHRSANALVTVPTSGSVPPWIGHALSPKFFYRSSGLAPPPLYPRRSVGRVANGVTRRFSDKAARPFQLKKAVRSGLLNSNVRIEGHAKRKCRFVFRRTTRTHLPSSIKGQSPQRRSSSPRFQSRCSLSKA
jgi:hypothetical protein